METGEIKNDKTIPAAQPQRSLPMQDIGAEWEGELTYCDLGVLLRVQRNYAAAASALQRVLDAAIAVKNRWWLSCRVRVFGHGSGRLSSDSTTSIGSSGGVETTETELFYAWGLAELWQLKI